MTLEQQKIEQLTKIKTGNPTLNLIRPCRVNDGIQLISNSQSRNYIRLFNEKVQNKKITFFTPASGSGSRMFGELYNYINNKGQATGETIEFIEQFLNNIENFSFYNKLPQDLKDQLRNGDIIIIDLIKYILLNNGLSFGDLPKGLIPFHSYGKFIINPFQEHILQGTKIAGEKSEFHFTINPNFENKINHSLKILKEITGLDFSYSFSNQDKSSHSICFRTDNEIALDKDKHAILRPSGHGALIENLNTINADIIFIKNIDNIQHFDKAEKALSTKKALGGLLLKFQKDIFILLKKIDANSEEWSSIAQNIDKEYNLKIVPKNLSNKKWVFTFFNRPIRMCGMVKNEGQSGGGPFWVQNEKGEVNPQIIEKSQVSSEQLSILLHATHFNPVDIVCGVKDYRNNKFNLINFVNEDLYFIVNKMEKGDNIKYIEKPGLWNGGMYNWLTLFYEIDSGCFSPVKTILDLLKPPHLQD
jgi:hypothetical protein